MDQSWWLLNIAYATYVISPIFKEMLRLRLMALVVTGFFIAYGLSADINSIVWWNIGFGLVHLYQIVQLLILRYGTTLTEGDEWYRQMLLPSLEPAEFAMLWDIGTPQTFAPNERIINEGEDVADLMVIIEGAVDIDLGAGAFVRLRPLNLLGEMSLLRGGAACATVTASGPTEVRCWDKRALLELGLQHPRIKDAALMLIGKQLAEKALNTPNHMA